MTRTWIPIAAWLVLAAAGAVTGWLPLIVAAPLALLPLPWLWSRRRNPDPLDLLEPIWLVALLFAFAYFVIPILAPLEPETFASIGSYLDTPPAQWEMATWMAGLAFIALLAGYFGPVGPWLAARIPAAGRPDAGIVVPVTAAVLVVFGLVAMAAALRSAGGGTASVSDIFTGRLRDETVASFLGRGYLSVGLNLVALAPPLTAVWAARGQGRARWAWVVACTLVMLLVLGAFLGSRNFALGSLLAVMVVVHYRVQRLPVWVLGGGAAVIILAAIGLIVGRGSGSASDPLAAAGALSLTFDGFNFLVNTLARAGDPFWGLTVAEDGLITYIPRGIWDDKPLIYGFLRAQEAVVPGLSADLQFRGSFPVGIVAEGYLNFGIAGALAFPLVLAAALRTLYVRVRVRDDDFTLLLLAWLIANVTGMIRGLGFVLPFVLIGILALLPVLIAQRRRPAAA